MDTDIVRWLQGRIRDLDREAEVLRGVLDRLTEDQPDGWAQVGSRGDE